MQALINGTEYSMRAINFGEISSLLNTSTEDFVVRVLEEVKGAGYIAVSLAGGDLGTVYTLDHPDIAAEYPPSVIAEATKRASLVMDAFKSGLIQSVNPNSVPQMSPQTGLQELNSRLPVLSGEPSGL